MLSFIHLSDIHFHRYSNDRYDVDKDLRNELLLDVKENYAKSIDHTDGILICGDVAFSGKKEEYSTATEFLKELCGAVQLEETEVYCVPGNHDIDQSVPEDEVCVKDLQTALEAQEGQNMFDARLAAVMRGKVSKEVLAKPLSSYTEDFASRYSCYMENLLTWQHDLPLGEGHTLRLYGINSTLISNADDHANGRKDQRPMRVSNLQMPERHDGVIYLTLCHHPPEHWNDPKEHLRTLLDKRVAVQLYGHKHLQKIVQRESSLIIGSGATHPSRREPDWLPRYNWLSLEVVPAGNKALLKATIYPRIFKDGRFVADHGSVGEEDFMESYIPLNGCKPMPLCEENRKGKGAAKNKLCGSSWKRRFVYDFMNLPYLERNRVLEEVQLIGEEDAGKLHSELLPAIIERAEERDCTEQLRNAVARRAAL